MKKIFLLIVLSAVVYVSKSQDLIYTKQETIEANVKEVKEQWVSYKKYDNPNGPVYEISKSKIDSIVYANGSKDIFERKNIIQETKNIYGPLIQKKYSDSRTSSLTGGIMFGNLITYYDNFNSVEGELLSLYVDYQKLFWDNRIGVSAIPFIGLNKEGYGVALNTRYYLKRKGRYKIAFGPEARFSRQKIDYHTYNQAGNYWQNIGGMATVNTIAFNIFQSVDIADDFLIKFEVIPGGVFSKGFDDFRSVKNYEYTSVRLGLGYKF